MHNNEFPQNKIEERLNSNNNPYKKNNSVNIINSIYTNESGNNFGLNNNNIKHYNNIKNKKNSNTSNLYFSN